MSVLVFFSSRSENTLRFITSVGLPAIRIPVNNTEHIQVTIPYILVVPSYGDIYKRKSAVPVQVKYFLDDAGHQALIRGVIASGNRSFGEAFAYAGNIISKKFNVPYLWRFELMGTQYDIDKVRQGVIKFWQHKQKKS